MIPDVNTAPVPIIHAPGFEPFTKVIYILSACVSLLVFLYGVLIIILDTRVWQNHIVRIIIVVQIINFLRFIFRILATFITVREEFGCRALLFLHNSTTLLPVNLCIYCVVYLQIIIVHQVQPYKRWPKAVLLSFAILTAIVPAASFLYISPSTAGIASYCRIPKVFNHRHFVYYNLSFALWQYLSGVIGVVSGSILGLYILRTQRVPQSILRTSTYSYGQSQTIIQQSHTNMLHRTLLSIVWFPITPIISLWFNLLLFSVSYSRQKTFTSLEYINVLLLGLQSVLLGMGLIVNPTVEKTFRKEIWDRWIKTNKSSRSNQPMVSHMEDVEQRLHVPLNLSTPLSLDDALVSPVSEF